jgi:hypothetical protein
VTISSVRILHANRTRRSFLERVVEPILSANRTEPYTLEEALKEVGDATDKLNRFGMAARDMNVLQLTMIRHFQVAHFSLPRPTEPVDCLLVTDRRRCIHLRIRARQLHHQDRNRGRRIGSGCLRTC